MGMMDAVKMFFNRYTDFQGRSRRAEYWWVYLFNFLLTLIPYFIMFSVGGFASGEPNIIGWLMFAIMTIYFLAIIVPSIAIGFRRLHDRDMSAWWLLLSLIPYLGGLILLVLFALPGTQGPNKYGPDPKGGVAADTFT